MLHGSVLNFLRNLLEVTVIKICLFKGRKASLPKVRYFKFQAIFVLNFTTVPCHTYILNLLIYLLNLLNSTENGFGVKMSFNFLDDVLGDIDSNKMIKIPHNCYRIPGEIFISDQSVECARQFRSLTNIVLNRSAVFGHIFRHTLKRSLLLQSGSYLESRVSYEMDDLSYDLTAPGSL